MNAPRPHSLLLGLLLLACPWSASVSATEPVIHPVDSGTGSLEEALRNAALVPAAGGLRIARTADPDTKAADGGQIRSVNGTPGCAGYTFPYTLSGADNAARVTELREAISCANAGSDAVDIDLGGQTLVFSDGPYSDADGPNALPILTQTFTLLNGAMERDASAPQFRFLKAGTGAPLHLGNMRFRNGYSTTDGGAVLADYVFNSGMTRFENNRADGNGGALRLRDPGSNNLLFATDFHGNAAAQGAALAHDSFVTLFNSRIDGNGDENSLSVIRGSTGCGMVSVLITDNQLPAAGSTLFHYENPVTGRPELRNVTVANNHVSGELFHVLGNNAFAYNSIIWGNVQGSLGAFNADYSILQGVTPNPPHLINKAPGFVDAANGNYRLESGSPGIDASLEGYLFPDIFDIDGDGNTTEMMPDLDLNNRPYDDTTVANTGTGNAATLDLGPYERQTDSAPAGITVNPVSGRVTSEAGGSDTFTVVLDRYPSANVSIGLSSSDTSEGTVSPTSFVFTQSDWNIAQTVTVNGVDDALVDGDIVYNIITAAAVSTDPDYSGINPADVSVTNTDDDTVCASYSFPYTLSGADNTARVAELRQAIECANANATDDVIDLAGQTLSLGDGPYTDIGNPFALPIVTSAVTLRHGELQRDPGAVVPFGIISSNVVSHLIVDGMTFRGARSAANGGAISSSGVLEIHASNFFDNQSSGPTGSAQGGAVYYAPNSSPMIVRDSLFEGNQADGRGGAIASDRGDIRHAQFRSNTGDRGGAVYLNRSSVVIDSQFIGNEAAWAGALGFTEALDVVNSVFEGNRATFSGGAIGEADHIEGALQVANSLFVDNSVDAGENIVTPLKGRAELINITATGNTTGSGGALFGVFIDPVHPSGPFTVSNSILWANSAPTGEVEVDRSIVQGGFPGGTDILNADPLFVDAANGDYTLAAHSPAIDAGDNSVVRPDTFDANGNANTSEDTPDLANNSRRYNDINVVDTGAGTAPVVDLGALERQIDSPDAPGVTVGPTVGLITMESGGTANFTIVLDSQPTSDVTIPLASSDTTEGTVAPASITFTAANWNTAQNVTITGVDDSEIDGDIAYTIDAGPASSADAGYNSIAIATIAVSNQDDDGTDGSTVPNAIPVDAAWALIGLMLAMLIIGAGAMQRRGSSPF